MDSFTTRVRTSCQLAVRGQAWLANALFLSALALVALTARLVWHVPEALLTTLGTSLLLVGLAAWALHGLRRPPLRRWMVWAGLVWPCLVAAFLGAVYRVDRGGWLWFRLTGYERAPQEEMSESMAWSASDFLRHNPMFSLVQGSATDLLLKSAVYDIEETLIIPQGLSLTIEPGTVLRFAPGRSLISYSPIIARGTARQPIEFNARWPLLKWGVIGIVRAGPSVFEHVRIRNGRYARVNQLDFPGTLSLLQSDAVVTGSQFVNLFGRDALYVWNARAEIRGNMFRTTYKDGVDFDGGSGVIADNQFLDCGDEGLDLSGDYDLAIFGNTVRDSGGGRIAVEKDRETVRASNSFGYSLKK